MSIDSIISLILTDKRLSALRKKIVSGKGTFSDTFDYTSYSANLMGQLFSGEVLDMPEEERKSTCISLLRDRYTDINALLDTTQRALDKAQGLALAPRHVPFDEERAAQIGDSLTDKTVPDETIVRRAGSAPVTAVRSMHDDYIEENAEFRSKAGLQCYINRVTDGKCCKWCSKMAGRFEYGDEPDGIFRRHDNCGCSVTYECGRQRQNVWTKKTWEVPETDAGAPPPTVFSQEQARKTEQEKLAQIVHKPSIDKLAESGIINHARVIDSMFYADDYEYQTYTKEEIIENLKTSAVGLETIQYLENNPQVKLKLSEDREATDRGQHEGNLLTVWLSNCPNIRVAAQTVVHEVAHHKYNIGGSQLAETICFAFEKMHKENRKYLTQQEWNDLVILARRAYWDLPAKGGVDNLERFDFIVKKR